MSNDDTGDREDYLIELSPQEMEPGDPKKYLADGFRDAFFRSKEVRRRLWGLHDDAVKKISNILLLPEGDEKTLNAQLNAAKYVLDSNMVQFPTMNHSSIDVRTNETPKGMKPYSPVAREEVIEAAVIAIQAENHKGEKDDEGQGS